jgi:phage/plasmid-like protein (TIGR03299 family)
MAHQIDETSIGRASYASTQREWHGLGETMQQGASIEEWATAAGMSYRVKRAAVRYAISHAEDDQHPDAFRKVPGQVVLFRDDTKADLGIVSEGYKIVQPRDVLEFFREWAEMGGMTIESAGVLFGGRRYFATAKLADGVMIGTGDKVVPYALLSTSADGSLATECRWTTVRTVCNNTLTMARKDSKASHRTTHRSVFKPAEARAACEAAHGEFGAFVETARMLAGVKLASAAAGDLTARLLTTGAREEKAARESAAFAKIMASFSGAGKGANLDTARGTSWGWLNAVTDYVDHEARAYSDEHRAVAAQWGQGEKLKNKALDLLSA